MSNNSNTINKQLKNITQRATNTISNTTNKIQSKIGDLGDKLKSARNNILGNPSNNTTKLGKINKGTKNMIDSAQAFAEANTTISKVVFILFLIIIFGLFLRLGIYILGLFYTPSKSPIVVNGMRPTNKQKVYQVNPNVSDPKPILRSINEDQGMEFSWSTWIWMDNTEYGDQTTFKRIFSKGNSVNESDNVKQMSAPGIFAHPNTNAIDVVLATFNNDSYNQLYETITVNNIPMQKWVNIVIRVQNKTVDVYINGALVERKNMDVVPKQNYGNIYVGDGINGMNGYISSLRYFNHAIGHGQIQDLMYKGPNLKMEGDMWNNTSPPYLSLKWYFNN